MAGPAAFGLNVDPNIGGLAIAGGVGLYFIAACAPAGFAWPLLLVIAGTVLSRDTVTDNGNAVQEKIADLSISRPYVRR